MSNAALIDALLTVQGTPEGLYGRRKMTHWLRRQGHQVAFCTADRLMRELGMNGVRRGRAVRTTVPAKDGHRAGDLLGRDFTAPAPNTRWVADFTYCRTWAGFVYVSFIVAFIVDVYAQRIVGWHVASTKQTDLVLTPLRIARWDRGRQGTPVGPGPASQAAGHRPSRAAARAVARPRRGPFSLLCVSAVLSGSGCWLIFLYS